MSFHFLENRLDFLHFLDITIQPLQRQDSCSEDFSRLLLLHRDTFNLASLNMRAGNLEELTALESSMKVKHTNGSATVFFWRPFASQQINPKGTETSRQGAQGVEDAHAHEEVSPEIGKYKQRIRPKESVCLEKEAPAPVARSKNRLLLHLRKPPKEQKCQVAGVEPQHIRSPPNNEAIQVPPNALLSKRPRENDKEAEKSLRETSTNAFASASCKTGLDPIHIACRDGASLANIQSLCEDNPDLLFLETPASCVDCGFFINSLLLPSGKLFRAN